MTDYVDEECMTHMICLDEKDNICCWINVDGVWCCDDRLTHGSWRTVCGCLYPTISFV